MLTQGMGVCTISDFNFFLASGYDVRWPVLSLASDISHQQCTLIVLIIQQSSLGEHLQQKSSISSGRELDIELFGVVNSLVYSLAQTV